jgi:hypothetical protein
VDYQGLIKRLQVPDGFAAPRELAFEDLRATVLDRNDLADDVAGVNESIDLIRRTRGGGWPVEPVTPDDDYIDLVWHEAEFREGYSFSYTVRDDSGRYVGCCYLYPLGRRTPLSDDLMACDVDVSWWVTTAAYEAGHYESLYRALQKWTVTEFPFRRPHYSNVEIPSPGS